jgi:signal peptidase I
VKNAPSNYRTFLYIISSFGLVVAAVFAYEFFYRYPIWTLRAFRVPSSSMCPTICSGERVLAQMQYGKVYVPKRGDVILFQYGPDHVLFIKRIIGLPGDAVAAGPANKILVNDSAWQPPPVCGRSLSLPDNSSAVSFATRKVPTGQVFVIGDNLNNSLDSPNRTIRTRQS